MRQHLPLAATTVQIQERIEYLAHIELPGPASPIVAGRWHQGLHDGPLGIREIRGICLPLSVLLRPPYAPLCLLRLAPPFYHTFCQNQFPESLLVFLPFCSATFPTFGLLNWTRAHVCAPLRVL